jgi:predicted DsbA family dithiol-disulfide isomerase
MEKPHLDIAFVSDVACPWCAIGLASLDQALERLRPDVDVTVRVEPFELNPDMPAGGEKVVDYARRKYGRTPEQLAQVQAMIFERGEAVGFKFVPRDRVWNTLNAHRMLQWASQEGKALELKRAILHAFHGEGRNPGDPELLVQLATKVGLDPVRAKEIAHGHDFEPEVREREYSWMQRGVNGVPLVVVNDKYGISGAQTPEGYEEALRQIARETAEAAA